MSGGPLPSLADDLLPIFDVDSEHSILVKAPIGTVYGHARALDMSGSWIIRTLFRIRGLPASSLNAEGLARVRFRPICEYPGTAFALGIIGQFWTPTGRLLDVDPSDFTTFSASGFAKALWTFDVAEERDATRLRTVTRVQCLDEASRRRFRRYWTLIRPFSGVIRTRVLHLIKSAAEAEANASLA